MGKKQRMKKTAQKQGGAGGAAGSAATSSSIPAPAPHSLTHYDRFAHIGDSDDETDNTYPASDVRTAACKDSNCPACPSGRYDSEEQDDTWGAHPAPGGCAIHSPAPAKQSLEAGRSKAADIKKPALRKGFFGAGSKPDDGASSGAAGNVPRPASGSTGSNLIMNKQMRALVDKRWPHGPLTLGGERMELRGAPGAADDDDDDKPPSLQSQSGSEESGLDFEESDSSFETDEGSSCDETEKVPGKGSKCNGRAVPSPAEPSTAPQLPGLTKARLSAAKPAAKVSGAKPAAPADLPACTAIATSSKHATANGSQSNNENLKAAPAVDLSDRLGLQTYGEQVEKFKMSVESGAMSPELAKRLRDGAYKNEAPTSSSFSFQSDASKKAPASSTATTKGSAATKAVPKGQPAAKHAGPNTTADVQGTKAAAPSGAAAADKPRAAKAQQQHVNNAAAKSKKSPAEANNPMDNEVLPELAGPSDDEALQQSQKRPKAATQSAEQARRELEKASEEHFRALMEEEERAQQDKEQQRKAQEKKDTVKREKRKSKARKKKEKGQGKAAKGEKLGVQPGEGSSKDRDASDNEDIEEEEEQSVTTQEMQLSSGPTEGAQPIAPKTASSLAAANVAARRAAAAANAKKKAEESMETPRSVSDNRGGVTSSNPFDILLSPGSSKPAARAALPASTSPRRPPMGGALPQQSRPALQRPSPSAQISAEQLGPPSNQGGGPHVPTPMPEANGFVTPANLSQAQRAWTALDDALFSQSSDVLLAAVAITSHWLAKHGTSKVFLAANAEMKLRLTRAKQLLATQATRNLPASMTARPTPSHTIRAHNPAAQRRAAGRGPPPPAYIPLLTARAAVSAAYAPGPADAGDPFGGVPMGGRPSVQLPSAPAAPAQGQPVRPAAFNTSGATPQSRSLAGPLPQGMESLAQPPPPPRKSPLKAPMPMSFNAVPQSSAVDMHEDDEFVCIVCMDWPSDVALFPCGHKNLCRACAEEVRKHAEGLCPSCRQPILEIVSPT